MQGFNMGRWIPPDFDPGRHSSLNGYHRQTHGLRKKKKKQEPSGSSGVRFEIPFDLRCGKCDETVAQGTRFNADKDKVGMYHSTPVWHFRCRHHCGGEIVIQTDPKNACFVVASGAEARVVGHAYTDLDGNAVEFPPPGTDRQDDDDAFAALERRQTHTLSVEPVLASLQEQTARRWDDSFARNKHLRTRFRARKQHEAAAAERRRLDRYGLALPLVDEDERDIRLARSLELATVPPVQGLSLERRRRMLCAGKREQADGVWQSSARQDERGKGRGVQLDVRRRVAPLSSAPSSPPPPPRLVEYASD